jgi:CDP-6-deoxy-D-xylo-4-hexulose-3-dehydrase
MIQLPKSPKVWQESIIASVERWTDSIRPPEINPGVDVIPVSGKWFDYKEVQAAVSAAVECHWTEGEWAQMFERELADFLGLRYGALTNSGSSANLLAMMALGEQGLGYLRRGDKVLTTACGFPTTLNPILQAGFQPVFLDIDLPTFVPRADTILEALERYGAKAVFIAHTLGNPWRVDLVREAARGPFLIEDNCDALGSQIKGKFTGSFGDASTQSFYPAHHITTGEGGMFLTSDPKLNKVARSLRDWGRDCWCAPGKQNTCGKRFAWMWEDEEYHCGIQSGYDHKYVYSRIGYNLKSTDFQASIGVQQLDKLPGFMAKRAVNWIQLWWALSDLAAKGRIILPEATQDAVPNWFGFPFLLREPCDLNHFVRYLWDHKIDSRPVFGGNLLRQPAYASLNAEIHGSLDNSDNVMSHALWVGVWPGLNSAHIEYMAEIIVRYFDEN